MQLLNTQAYSMFVRIRKVHGILSRPEKTYNSGRCHEEVKLAFLAANTELTSNMAFG